MQEPSGTGWSRHRMLVHIRQTSDRSFASHTVIVGDGHISPAARIATYLVSFKVCFGTEKAYKLQSNKMALSLWKTCRQAYSRRAREHGFTFITKQPISLSEPIKISPESPGPFGPFRNLYEKPRTKPNPADKCKDLADKYCGSIMRQLSSTNLLLTWLWQMQRSRW